MVGPLAVNPEPHTYDLCESHARTLTAPRGWELVRYDGEFEPPPPTPDDLVALADAVREAARPTQRQADPNVTPPARRGHLRAVPPPQ